MSDHGDADVDLEVSRTRISIVITSKEPMTSLQMVSVILDASRQAVVAVLERSVNKNAGDKTKKDPEA